MKIKTLTFQPMDSVPLTASLGEIYFNNTEKTIYFYNGNEWELI